MKDKRVRLIVLSIGIGTFMSSLDSSVVNLAMPVIKDHFAVSLSVVEWIITSYLLVVSSLLLTFGRLADMFGHKKMYQTGFMIFTASSLLCGFSVNVAMLVVFRIFQAIGAGMLYATGPAIITNAVPPQHRGKALSVSAVSVALGLSIGPIAGGTLATLLGWQSIFFINVPIGIVGILMARRNIPRDEPKARVPFDIPGSILVFFALLLILLPLNLSGDYDIAPSLFFGQIFLGLGLLIIFVAHERKCRYPMLSLSLFKNRVFAASNSAALFTYMAQAIMIFIIPFYFQTLLGYSAMMSGLFYLPMPLATMVIAPISGSLSDRLDSRYISSLGALFLACGLFMLSFLGTDTTIAYIVICMVVTGLGFGLFQTPNNSAIMGNVPPQNRGTASGTLATMRNTGMVLGVAVSGALFSFSQSKATRLFASQGQSGVTLANNAFVSALRVTFIVASVVALIAMSASLLKGKVKTELEKKREEEELHA